MVNAMAMTCNGFTRISSSVECLATMTKGTGKMLPGGENSTGLDVREGTLVPASPALALGLFRCDSSDDDSRWQSPETQCAGYMVAGTLRLSRILIYPCYPERRRRGPCQRRRTAGSRVR